MTNETLLNWRALGGHHSTLGDGVTVLFRSNNLTADYLV